MDNTGGAATAVMQMKWRQGMKLGRTLYAQIGAQPSEFDILIGMIDNSHLARYLVEIHNAQLATGVGAIIKTKTCRYELPDDPENDNSWKKCGKPGFQVTVFPPGEFFSEEYLDIRCREHRF